MASTIKLKNGSGAPTSGQLVQGEPALDLTNKRLYTENASGTVIEVGTNPSSLTTASADINGGTIDGTVIGGSSAAAGTFTSITGTSANINGTVTADGLTVTTGSASGTLATLKGSTGFGFTLASSGTAPYIQTIGVGSGEELAITSGGTTIALFQDGGDFQLYEDTGTAAKFFWDASAESLGIGTSSPTTNLHVYDPTANVVGTFESGDADVYITLADSTTTSDTAMRIGVTGNDMHFSTSATERMRIDSSGNLLVGTTDTNPAGSNVNGVAIRPSGFASSFTGEGGQAINLNRKANDGDIARFFKDGSSVGSIGAFSGVTYIGCATGGLMFNGLNLNPTGAGSTRTDGTNDIGSPTYRFKDLYLSGGVYLGGTGAANKLDDYEEGTWTPTIVGTTSGSATVSSITSATYTKIGRTVHVAAFIGIDTSTHTVVGVVEVGGLPFSPSSDSGTGTSTYSTVFTDNTIINLRPLTGNKLRMMKGSTSSSYTNTDLTSATSRVLIFSAVYETTA